MSTKFPPWIAFRAREREREKLREKLRERERERSIRRAEKNVMEVKCAITRDAKGECAP